MTELTDSPNPFIPRGLNYRGEVGDYSVYDFWLRGRVVLEVAVNNEDPELQIYVGQPGGMDLVAAEKGLVSHVLQVTRGRARWSTATIETDEDDVLEVATDDMPRVIDVNSIRAYVNPRLAPLIARVFVPGDRYAPAAE